MPDRSDVRLAWAPLPPTADRRAVAWDLVRGMLGPDARLDNPCPRCGGPHGGLVVSGVPAHAGVAYAGGFAVAATARADVAAAVGVDAESASRGARAPAGVGRVLARGADIRDWTRVEATLKALGTGLRTDPSLVRVETSAGAWTARVGTVALRGVDLDGPPGVVVSAAIVPRD